MNKALYRSIYISRVFASFIQIKRNPQVILSHANSRSRLSRLEELTRKMSTVYVKNFHDDDRLHITVDLSVNGGIKTFNLSRLKSEEHGTALERLRLSISKKLSNRKKKKKRSDKSQTSVSPEPEPEDEIILDIRSSHDGQKLPPSVTNEQAWIEESVLRYGEENITIVHNAPSVKFEKFPKIILSDFPLFPLAEYEFCGVDSCDFYWKTVEKNKVDPMKKSITTGAVTDVLKDFYHNLSFTPGVSDIGHHIALVCVPKNSSKVGKTEAIVSEGSIELGPKEKCPFEKRQEFTKTRLTDGRFRVVSYNLLADVYSSTDVAQNHLFAHCPEKFLNMEYRKHLLLKEIIGYNADLMFFQEVDKSIFSSHLIPALKTLGYEGLLCLKAGQTSEGCATFINSEKFRIVNQANIVLAEFLTQDPSCKDILGKVERVGPLKQNVEQRSSILQVTVVESVEKPNKFLCLANTHFYYHPDACNVRLLLAAAALRYLQNLCRSYEQEGKPLSIVFCGDFNSGPHLGVFQLMTAQFVPSDHVDWKSGGKSEMITDLELSHTMNLESACGQPEYTNFTVGFKCTLDYIFIDSSKLKTTSVVPMPEHSDVIANIALPSELFPSDHIALVCELDFTS